MADHIQSEDSVWANAATLNKVDQPPAKDKLIKLLKENSQSQELVHW